MGREGKTLVQFGSLKVIPNLYSSKSLSDRWQVAPDTGQPDHVLMAGRHPDSVALLLCPLLATPKPDGTGSDPTGVCCSCLVCPLSLKTPSVFAQVGKGSM